MSELKKCPFCGSEPNLTPNHTVICNTCHREVLPEIWQTRPLEDALQTRVEELENSISKAVEEIENMRGFEPEDEYDIEWLHAVTRVLGILRKHGLIGGNK